MIKKIISLLSSTQKKSAILLVFMMFISSLLEVLGLGLIIVIMDFLLGSVDSNNSFIIKIIGNYLPDNANSILIILSIFFVVFFFKIVLLIYLSWFESNFVAKFKERLSNTLFDNFLKRQAYQILKKNSSEYLRNFTTEIDLIGVFYYSALKLTLEITLLIILFVFLVNFDIISSIASISVLSILSLVYFFIVKKFI